MIRLVIIGSKTAKIFDFAPSLKDFLSKKGVGKTVDKKVDGRIDGHKKQGNACQDHGPEWNMVTGIFEFFNSEKFIKIE